MYSGRDIDVPNLLIALKNRVGSIRRIAGFVKVSEKAVSDWEKGHSKIRPEHLDKLVELACDQGIHPDMYLSSPSLWDFKRSYRENLGLVPPLPITNSYWYQNKPIVFLGRRINSPFGASASVLTSSSERISFLARTGSDVITYKTVRSSEYPSHVLPNLLFGVVASLGADRSPFEIPNVVLVSDDPSEFDPKEGLMNRFGMPCPGPEVWQSDFEAAKRSMNPNQLLILSVVGTPPSDSKLTSSKVEKLLIDDFIKVVALGMDAGAEVIELNVSCPNCSGIEGSLCDNIELVIRICRAVVGAAADTKFILKLGFMEKSRLREIVMATAGLVHGYSGINTIPVEGKRQGQHGPEPAFGIPFLKAGLSGGPIFRHGLKFIKQLNEIRTEEHLEFEIIGCGGVVSPADVHQYLKNGASVVQATTAFFKNSFFGIDVQQGLRPILRNHEVRLADELTIGWRNWYRARQNLRMKFASKPGTLQEMEMSAATYFHEWETSYSHEASLGKRRTSIPTVSEFESAIQAR